MTAVPAIAPIVTAPSLPPIAAQADPRSIYPCTRNLFHMLTYMRPGRSPAEEEFVQKFVAVLPGAKADAYGNYWVTVPEVTVLGTLIEASNAPQSAPTSPILWSCHTDTVHTQGGRQRLVYASEEGMVSADNSSCLGADCTAGVWLMVEMVNAGIPGLYLFHRDEEIGARGSQWIAEHKQLDIAHIKFAIAFDRKGYNEVITHQFYRTCSDEFACLLVNALSPLEYQPSDKGIFTDTQSYAELIPECTNIGVGYFSAHTSRECLDIPFIVSLRERLLTADFSRLVAIRDPLESDDSWARNADRWHGSGTSDARHTYGMSSSRSAGAEREVCWSQDSFWLTNWDVHKLHYVKISKDDPRLISFYKLDKKNKPHRINMKPGKYLNKYFGGILSQDDVARLVRRHNALVTTGGAFPATQAQPLSCYSPTDYIDVLEVVKYYPEEVAEFMLTRGITLAQFDEYIASCRDRFASTANDHDYGPEPEIH